MEGTYRGTLAHDETLPEGIEQLAQALERQGWAVNHRRGNRLRYWCGCAKQHQFWVDLFPDSETYPTETAAILAGRTCYTH